MKNSICVFLAFVFATSLASAAAYEITKEDRDFFNELRTAVLADDAARVAALVQFPISVRVKEKEITLTGSRDFAQHYREIVTSDVKTAVRQQSAERLQKNWQGVMIGSGQIWFEEIKPEGAQKFVRKVIAFNP